MGPSRRVTVGGDPSRRFPHSGGRPVHVTGCRSGPGIGRPVPGEVACPPHVTPDRHRADEPDGRRVVDLARRRRAPAQGHRRRPRWCRRARRSVPCCGPTSKSGSRASRSRRSPRPSPPARPRRPRGGSRSRARPKRAPDVSVILAPGSGKRRRDDDGERGERPPRAPRARRGPTRRSGARRIAANGGDRGERRGAVAAALAVPVDAVRATATAARLVASGPRRRRRPCTATRCWRRCDPSRSPWPSSCCGAACRPCARPSTTQNTAAKASGKPPGRRRRAPGHGRRAPARRAPGRLEGPRLGGADRRQGLPAARAAGRRGGVAHGQPRRRGPRHGQGAPGVARPAHDRPARGVAGPHHERTQRRAGASRPSRPPSARPSPGPAARPIWPSGSPAPPGRP